MCYEWNLVKLLYLLVCVWIVFYIVFYVIDLISFLYSLMFDSVFFIVGVVIDCEDKNGNIFLYIAVRYGYELLINIFIISGVDIVK